jgi:hypothetical protein
LKRLTPGPTPYTPTNKKLKLFKRVQWASVFKPLTIPQVAFQKERRPMEGGIAGDGSSATKFFDDPKFPH